MCFESKKEIYLPSVLLCVYRRYFIPPTYRRHDLKCLTLLEVYLSWVLGIG